jgi:hypothetical protein
MYVCREILNVRARIRDESAVIALTESSPFCLATCINNNNQKYLGVFYLGCHPILLWAWSDWRAVRGRFSDAGCVPSEKFPPRTGMEKLKTNSNIEDTISAHGSVHIPEH